MKAQVLVDFLVECTWSANKPEGVSVEPPGKPPDVGLTWIFYMDDASNS